MLSVLLLLLGNLYFGSYTFAAAYPWAAIGEDDLTLVESPQLDLAVRVGLIQKAQSTIDIVMYHQMKDPKVGLPILSALRDAANRGVRVRLLTTWIANTKKNYLGYLLKPATVRPIEVLTFGGLGQSLKGWNIVESVHEKILIVDDKAALLSGRGHADIYQNWLDTSFLLKGALVGQVLEATHALWREVAQIKHPRQSKASGTSRSERFVPAAPAESFGHTDMEYRAQPEEVRIEHPELTADDQALYAGILNTWNSSPVTSSPLLGRGRTLHFNMVAQHRWFWDRVEGSVEYRYQYYQDPVIDAIVDKIKTAREIRFTTLSILLHPKLKQALIEAASGGAKVIIFTNGPDVKFDPFNFPWACSIGDIADLLQVPGITVQVLLPKGQGPWAFLHRKLAIVDDTVYFGSHNLNLASSTHNDELSLEIESPAFAKKMREIYDRDVANSARPLLPAEVFEKVGSSLFTRLACRAVRASF